jgi:peptidoglycan hydrolase CwlO-like protein
MMAHMDEKFKADYKTDQDISKYINDHRHLIESCSSVLDDRTEELDNANYRIHELEKEIKELRKEITTMW